MRAKELHRLSATAKAAFLFLRDSPTNRLEFHHSDGSYTGNKSLAFELCEADIAALYTARLIYEVERRDSETRLREYALTEEGLALPLEALNHE